LWRAPSSHGQVASISDVGCGDEKLRRLIDERGWRIRYQGFDLLPQSDAVQFVDLNQSPPGGSSDLAVALGVLEYVEDAAASLRRLAEHAPLLVVSHTVRDADRFSEQAQQARGWKNYMFADEFAELLAANRWRVLDMRSTSNGRTRLWLAERIDAPGC
jgi:hypothetical protein